MPVRIQRRRSKGWKLPAGAICVDRSTRWGNPFAIGRMKRDCVVFAHKALLHGYICITSDVGPDAQRAYALYVRRNLSRLRGKDLACWCRLDQPCHADTLLELANR